MPSFAPNKFHFTEGGHHPQLSKVRCAFGLSVCLYFLGRMLLDVPALVYCAIMMKKLWSMHEPATYIVLWSKDMRRILAAYPQYHKATARTAREKREHHGPVRLLSCVLEAVFM